jgi:hypothetical protein
MSRRNATNTNTSSSPNKRVRFDATSAPASSGDISTTIISTPLSVADNLIKNHIASLQPQLASILGKLGHKHVSLLHKLYNKQSQVNRMESDEDFIPRSARIDFQFHMSKNAEERPEFLALQEETNAHITTFRKLLRQQIIKATKIEMETLMDDIKLGFVKNIRVSIEAFLIGDDTGLTVDDNTLHSTVSSLMENRNPTLLRHSTFTSYEDFCDFYKRLNNLSGFPIVHTGAGNSSTPLATSRFFNSGTNNSQANRSNNTTPVSTLELDKISRALESIFITPFDEYLNQCKKNQINMNLKKLSTMHFTEESTNDSQMHLDREPAADRIQLQSLIKKQTQAETKSLVKELHKLQEKLKAIEKKSVGGPLATSGAPTKQVRQSATKKKNGKNKEKVGEHVNDSKSNKGNKNNRKGKNSKKNNTRSQTRRTN